MIIKEMITLSHMIENEDGSRVIEKNSFVFADGSVVLFVQCDFLQ